jgi:mannobiose 2-epimerase
MNKEQAKTLRSGLLSELTGSLLPFWIERTQDGAHGGFIGRMSNDLVVEDRAPKGLVLNARILWTFSAAHRFQPKDVYLAMARRAYEYLQEHFWDPENGGAYWMVDYAGDRLDDKKKTYGQAFLLYALAEFCGATGDLGALDRTKTLFEWIEAAAWDPVHQGYLETFERDWSPASDLRLSDRDMNEAKSMNTHLHVLEAYTNLYRIWPETLVRQRLEALIGLFTGRIIDPDTLHFRLFFDETWKSKSSTASYGHDIEGSWLLCEAAEVLGERRRIAAVRRQALEMAGAVYRDGLDGNGGLLYEGGPEGVVDHDRHWWPQAEAVVGFLNAYSISKEKRYWDAALGMWDYIRKTMVDGKRGEWFWRVSAEGVPYETEFKVSEWKCPYHNSRMCLEGIRRIDSLTATSSRPSKAAGSRKFV